jgi:hypothetical protein
MRETYYVEQAGGSAEGMGVIFEKTQPIETARAAKFVRPHVVVMGFRAGRGGID